MTNSMDTLPRRENPRGWHGRRLSLPCVAALVVVGACSDGRPTEPAPRTGRSDTVEVRASYEHAGVLSSSPDTCPWYTIPPELWDPFQVEMEQPVSNPDSVEASYGDNGYNPDFYAPILLLDGDTGAELYAGPCEVARNRCWAKCRRIPAWEKRVRALCWGGCMTAYALCKQREREKSPPVSGGGCSTGCEYQIIYDPETCDPDPWCGGSGGGGGDSDGGGDGGTNCSTQYIIIEVNDGTGWRVWWEGYATVCE